MVKFKFEDYKRLTPTKELESYLSQYTGVIPKLLIPFNNYKIYIYNLKKEEIYDKVMSDYYKVRVERKKSNNKQEYDKIELMNFIKKNKELDEILNRSIN